MTVQDLIGALLQCPPDALVILSKDAEGTRFSPADTFDEGVYTADSSDAGAFVCSGDAPEGENANAVCLWPVA